MDIFSSLIVVLVMSSTVTCNPVVDYNEDLWRGAFPFLNKTFVEYCYFGSDHFTSKDFGTQRIDFYCSLISNQTHNCYMSSNFLEPLKQYFAHLVDNNSNVTDRLQVLDCFAKHRCGDPAKLDKCWMVDSASNYTSCNISIRQRYSKTYFNRLSEVSTKIEQCLKKPKCRSPGQDFELAKHCELYHSKKFLLSHAPCGKITKSSQVPTVPLMDERSLAHYFGHANATASSAELYRSIFKNALPEALKQYHPQMVSCFIDDSWFDEPAHGCRNITKPLDGVVYSEQDQQLNKYWQKVVDALDLE